VVVESLAQEFDVIDVAAAAIKMAHSATAADRESGESDLDVPMPARRDGPPSEGRDRDASRRGGRPARRDGNVARLFVGAGRRAGIRPADLVGAISGEAGVPSRALGAIEITDTFSLVEVPDELADEIVAAMRKATLRGQKVTIRRDRDQE
jgi:ATP-dependent RNA helicase DeaD